MEATANHSGYFTLLGFTRALLTQEQPLLTFASDIAPGLIWSGCLGKEVGLAIPTPLISEMEYVRSGFSERKTTCLGFSGSLKFHEPGKRNMRERSCVESNLNGCANSAKPR